MRLYERDGKTAFPARRYGLDEDKEVSFLQEERDGIPYCYLFVLGEESEAEAGVNFEKYMASDQAKMDVEDWKMSQRRAA